MVVGGFGREAYGDPFGAGGPLYVVRARAVKGQVVRVVYDEEPIHDSAAGTEDALNPSNYLFTVVGGTATSPVCVGVDEGMIIGPATAVQVGDERGFDVHTDRALVAGITYRVTAVGTKAKLGGALGSPFYADFAGIVRVQETQPPIRRQDFTDIRNSPFDGVFIVDGSGDLAIHTGIESLRKRVLRRLSTPKNAFAFLPGYGVGLGHKEPANIGRLQGLKADITQQVKQEPEVQDASVKLSLDQIGILTINVSVLTKRGALAEVALQRSAEGVITVP